MKKQKPLVDKKVILQKYPGKGGWTYADVPEIPQDNKAPFGWVKVKGSIDDYTFEQVKLMPKGNGLLFFPVKAAIRKAINKFEGDEVHIQLYLDKDPILISEDILSCLKDDPIAWEQFQRIGEGEQKSYLDWIEEGKQFTTKVSRIATMIENVKRGNRFQEKEIF